MNPLKVARLTVNARREARLQPLNNCLGKLLWIRTYAALAASDERGELLRDCRRILPNVVEVLGDEHPLALSVLEAVLGMIVEQRPTLHPSAIDRLMVDIVAAGLAPRLVEPRLFVLESEVMVVGIEVQYFRHFHSIEQLMPAVCGSMSHQPVTPREPKPLVIGSAGR
jgi:hypothetical protein